MVNIPPPRFLARKSAALGRLGGTAALGRLGGI
jgi:hypothetical protein